MLWYEILAALGFEPTLRKIRVAKTNALDLSAKLPRITMCISRIVTKMITQYQIIQFVAIRVYIKRRSLGEQTIGYIGLSSLPDFLKIVSYYSKEEKAVGFFLFVIRVYIIWVVNPGYNKERHLAHVN